MEMYGIPKRVNRILSQIEDRLRQDQRKLLSKRKLRKNFENVPRVIRPHVLSAVGLILNRSWKICSRWLDNKNTALFSGTIYFFIASSIRLDYYSDYDVRYCPKHSTENTSTESNTDLNN
jgi:hypothetical protein